MDLTKIQLGSYVVKQRIGKGGMGEVWEGYINPFLALLNSMLNDSVDPNSIEGSESARSTRKLLKSRLIQTIRTNTQRTNLGAATLPDDDLLKQDLETRARNYPHLSEEAKERAYDGCVMFLEHQQDLKSQKRAIKVLSPQYATNQKINARFRQEIKFQRALDHENIVRVIEYGKAQGQNPNEPIVYEVMEYIPALELETSKKLEAAGMNVERATHIVRNALEGLIYAHEKGVLHRDIKPANILVTEDYKIVKVTDFGVAKIMKDVEDRIETGSFDMSEHDLETATQSILGTPWYMSPEQATNTNIGPKSDLYSLGATYYFYLAGQPPLNIRDGKQALVQLVRGMDVQPISKLCADVSSDVEDVIMMLLAKDPEKRPSSIETRAMLDDIIDREAYCKPRKTPHRAHRIQELKRQTKKTTLFKNLVNMGELHEQLGNLHDADEQGLPHREHYLRQALNYYKRWIEAKDAESQNIIKYFSKKQRTDPDDLETMLTQDAPQGLAVLFERIATHNYDPRKHADQKIDALLSDMITDESVKDVFKQLNNGISLQVNSRGLAQSAEMLRGKLRDRIRGMAPYTKEQIDPFISDIIDTDIAREFSQYTIPLFEHIAKHQRVAVTRAPPDQIAQVLGNTLRDRIDQVYALMHAVSERDLLKTFTRTVQERVTVDDPETTHGLKGLQHVGLVTKIADRVQLLEKKVAMEGQRLQQYDLEPIPGTPKHSWRKRLGTIAAGLVLTGALAFGGIKLYNDYEQNQAREQLFANVDQHYSLALDALEEGNLARTAQELSAAQSLAADLPSGSERVQQLRLLEDQLQESRHYQRASSAYERAQRDFHEQNYASALEQLESALSETRHLGQTYESFITQVAEFQMRTRNWSNLSEAQTRYADVTTYLNQFELQPASEAIRTIEELLDRIEDPDETLQGHIRTLRESIQEHNTHIQEYELDIGTYNVCKRRLEEISTQVGTLETQLRTELVDQENLTSIRDRIDNIISRLNDPDQIRPEGVGYDTLNQTQQDATTLQQRISDAFTTWDTRALEYIQENLTRITGLLNQSQDYLSSEAQTCLQTAHQLIENTSSLAGQVQQEHRQANRIQEISAAHEQLMRQRETYQTLEQQDTDESRLQRARMQLGLVDYDASHLESARNLLNAIESQQYESQLQRLRTILDLEAQKRNEDNYIRITPAGLTQTHLETYTRLLEAQSYSNVIDMISMFEEYGMDVETSLATARSASRLQNELRTLQEDARVQAEEQLTQYHQALQNVSGRVQTELEQNGTLGPAPELIRRLEQAYHHAGIHD